MSDEYSVTYLFGENVTSTGKVNLLHAAEENDEAAAKFFVEKDDVQVSETNYDDDTAAHLAAKNGNINIIKMILARDPTILTATNAAGDTMLFLAIEKGHLHVVKYLVDERKANISEKNNRVFGCTAMHIAAQFGQLPILKYLVEEKKGDVNVRNKLKETPAFFAAENKHHHIIKYLLEEAKADLTLVDSGKNNVLYMAVKKNDLPLMKYLLDEKSIQVDVNGVNGLGATLVHQAAILNRVEILKYLIEQKKADVRIADGMNVSPLHSAAVRNHFETCELLIEKGADLSLRDYRNMTAVQYASDDRLAQYMKKAAQNRSRRSVPAPLMARPYYSQVELIDRGQRPLVADSFSNNSLTRASEGLFSPFSTCYLQSFLGAAQVIVRATKSSVSHLISSSPEESLGSKIDPVAIEAVQGIRHFPELREK